jgi:ATP10 protein
MLASFIAAGASLSPAATIPPSGDRIPPVHGTTFADVKVDLPQALHGKVGIFVIGFSQDSRDAITTWGKRLAGDFYDSPTVAYYEMPVLASVPKLLRGFVAGRIKASVSDRGKPHFLPITENESAWRNLVHYANPDAPYILLVDEQGNVHWQSQGPPTEATYAALKCELETLRPH